MPCCSKNAKTVLRVTASYGSRQTHAAGFSIRRTGMLLKKKILERAGAIVRIPESNLDIRDGNIVQIMTGEVVMDLGNLAKEILYSRSDSHHLTVESTSHIDSSPYTLGCTIAEVEVDIALCKIKLLNLTNCHDAGVLINPALAEAQVHGGMSMGLGYGLSEQLVFDKTTGQPLNNNLLDYKLLTCLDHPGLKADFVENPEPFDAFGAKGLGETSVCAGSAGYFHSELLCQCPPFQRQETDQNCTGSFWRRSRPDPCTDALSGGRRKRAGTE